MRLLATCTAVCIAISGALLLVFVMDPPVRKVSGSVLAAPVTSALPQSPPVFINEIHYDNIGPDEYELVEIAGPAGTDLTGWQLLLYDGTGGAPYGSYALSGTLLDQQHGTGVLVFNILGIQDGTPDGLALLDPNGTVLQFLSYEGTFSATEGPASGLSSEDIGVAEPGAIGKSLQLTGEGCTYGDFSWTGPLDSSAGQPNDGQAFQCSESTPSDAAPAALQTSPVDGAEDVAVNAAIVVTFSEPVSLSTVAFILTDSTGLTTTPSINGQDRVYTATLQTSIGHGTAYTLTVLSSAVHDLDTQDPPDVLPSDYILNFQTSPLKSGWIVNEIHADPSPEHGDANADGRVDMVEDEFIEIANYTGQAVDISGWTVSIAGADALDVHHVFPAGLVVPDRCAVVVFGGGTAYGSFGGAVPQVAYTPGGDSLSLNDTQGTVSLFDGSSVIASVAYGSEAGDDQSLTLSPDVTGTLPLVVHSSAAGAAGRLSSPGTLTDGTRFPGCPILVPIYAVQGTGDSSPFEGTYTTVEGVVTGDFQQQDDDTDHNLAGFYIQQLIGDGDPGTSDGIFVSDGPIPLLDITVGDWLRVSGTVEEVNGETRLQAAAISRVGTALSPQPVEFSLPVSAIRLDAGAPPTASLIADLEPVEGMWIRVLNPLTVASLDTSDEYGDFKVRPLSTPHDLAGQFTQYNLPNLAGFADHLADVARHTLTVDGGRDAGPLSINNPDGTSGSINLLRLGNVVTGLVGTVRFSSGSEGHGDGTYRLVPTQPPVLTVHNSRPVTPPRLKSRLRLAAVNLDAYFTTLATEGAGDADEFERQTQKLVTTLAELEADVYTLTGLEDNYAADESSALAILTNHLNQRVSSAGETDLFAYIDPGQNLVEYAANPSSAVGIMYRPSVLSPDAGLAVAILSNEQLPALELHGSTFSGDAGNRPAMAATFVENSTGDGSLSL